ncbi:uncharacterized protein METZ01_LOCUS451083 [marine metagenome]|uniref:Uncharacterized protein n=1 Tax=marine metagenome TaxID=408172 RepID=A0A382ZSK1_9ZZZZ
MNPLTFKETEKICIEIIINHHEVFAKLIIQLN